MPQAGSLHVLAGYEDGVVALWDVRAPGRPLAATRLHSEPVMRIALNSTSMHSQPAAAGARLSTPPPCSKTGCGGTVAASGVGQTCLPPVSAGFIEAVSGAPTSSAGPSLTDRPSDSSQLAASPSASPSSTASHPWCGISGSADSHLCFFTVDVSAGRLDLTHSLPLPSAGVGDVAIRADGRLAATGHWDGRVRLWHARRGAPLGVLRYHAKAVASVAFGGGGAKGPEALASGGRDGAVAVWEVVFGGRP